MNFNKNFLFAAILIIPFLTLTISCSKTDHADMVLYNGSVTTMDDTLKTAEAIAIKSDTIFAVGSNAEIKKLIGDSTEVIDAKGAFVMPGFIESHAHFLGLGKSKKQLKNNAIDCS